MKTIYPFLFLVACGGEIERKTAPVIPSEPAPAPPMLSPSPPPFAGSTGRQWLPRFMPAGPGFAIDRTTGIKWFTRGLYGYDSPLAPRDPVKECGAMGLKPARFAEVQALIDDPAVLPWQLPGSFSTASSIMHRVEEPGCVDLVYGKMSPECETLDGLFCVLRPGDK